MIVFSAPLLSISNELQGASGSIGPPQGDTTPNEPVNIAPDKVNSTLPFYQNATYGIETNYPVSWSIRESNSSSADSNYIPIVTFFSPTTIGSEETASSIKLARETIGNISLSDYVNVIVNQSKQDSPDFTLLSSKVNDTVPGYRLYAFDKFDGRDSYILEFGQLVDDKIYSVTYIADAIKYTEDLPLVQSTVDSLRVAGSQNGQVINFVSLEDSGAIVSKQIEGTPVSPDKATAFTDSAVTSTTTFTDSLANDESISDENVSAKKNINYAYLSQWGTLGKAQGQMIEPADFALSQEQTVYIADKGNNRIDMFDLNGTFLGGWG